MILPVQTASTNLTAPITHLIGRHTEINTLNQLLSDDKIRMITLLGPGGMGKTLLALEVARQQLHRFTEGVFQIVLPTPVTAEHFATLIADAMGCQIYPGDSTQQQILHFLQPRDLLLLVDNAEYSLDAVPYMSEILQTAPHVKIVATSQVKLNLYAETLFHLGGLSYNEDGTLPSPGNEAFELFIQRSKHVRTDFQITPQSQLAILEICRLTQGMPLALVLAASWTALLSPDEIVRELKHGFDFLEIDVHDVPKRQRSIRAIFDYTWKLMNDNERQMLARLSIFRHGFTREAAQNIAQGNLHSLMSLLKRALIQPSNHEGRFEVHELLRLYAAEHLLSSGEFETIAAAHSRYFLRFLQQHEQDIKGTRQLEILNAFQIDEENIWVAWQWAVQQHENILLSESLEGLFWYCMMRSRYSLFEAIHQVTQDIVAQPSALEVRLLVARLQLRYWWMRRWSKGSSAQHPEIIEALQVLIELFREFNTLREIAICTLLMGDAIHTVRDDFEQAQALLQTAYLAFIDLEDEYYAAWTLHFSAKQISDSQGIEAGIEQLNQVLELRRKHGDQIGAVYSLYNLSTDLLLLGRLEECTEITEEILSISRVTGERSSLLLAQITMSLLAFLAGRFEDVRKQNEINHSIASSLNHILGLAWTNLIQSFMDYFDGKTLSAAQALAASEKMAAQGVVRYFVHIAYALMQHTDEMTLKRHLLSAAHQADDFAAFGAQLWCLPLLAIWEANNGQPIHAVELLAMAQKQPASLMGWLPAWLERTSLQAQLEQKLGTEVFEIASIRGHALDVPTVIRSFISLTASPTATFLTISLTIQEANQQLFEPLSNRELEVLSYIGRGLSNREIANEMVVELSTVKKHLTHVYGKLAVSTRAQAILQAQKLHLV